MQRLALIATLFIIGACPRDTLEEDVDAEGICMAYCANVDTCGRLGDSCMDACLAEPQRMWEGECKHLRAEYITCLAELSCPALEKYLDHELLNPERECYDELFEFSACWAK